MAFSIREESLDALDSYFGQEKKLHWPSPFILPFWLKTWWESFGHEYELLILSAWDEHSILHGIAPMIQKDSCCSILGSPDVCDYLDFIIRPGSEKEFLLACLQYASAKGIGTCSLHSQRPDASFFLADKDGDISLKYPVSTNLEDRSYELKLPSNWDDYLKMLNKKQRHEVRRKMRKLENEKPDYSFRVITDQNQIEAANSLFFDLFLQNKEKEDFMTPQMKIYFENLFRNSSESGLAKLGLLEVDNSAVASVLFFDYFKRIYLYNSGYNNDYRDLSVGLLSKIYLIKDSLEKGFEFYDFLKGDEVYKKRLGGREVPIYNITISIGGENY